ncbi:CAAX geranylgeranyltransferase alpha subunit [Bonamia ostreae]|uniref:CAAX geranylgeranyltransferase alpha subunit n=1 Tax=Bonamia ostreae TaxID=126728 RepID=A0ABV2AHJ6_9EUKA
MKEVSKRALLLTTAAIPYNPTNYTIWHWRRKCLFELNEDLKEEMTFSEIIMKRAPKNYQIWFHRREVIKKMENFDLENEFKVLKQCLLQEPKNYHAWSHRLNFKNIF